jgi:hypothetical protein
MLIGRKPRIDEKDKMLSLYQEELNAFQENPKRAQELLNVGEYPADRSLKETELAAFSVLATTLMNFDEFVMKR